MFKKLFLIILPILLLTSCIVSVTNHGYEQDPENFIRLKSNKSNKSDVIREAGSPSIISTFNKGIWYYVSTKTRRVSAFKPKVIESRVIQLHFNNTDILDDVSIFTINEHRELKFNRAESSIKGDDTSPLKDFFYNFGRFNKVVK